jgi:hypothetical protein
MYRADRNSSGQSTSNSSGASSSGPGKRTLVEQVASTQQPGQATPGASGAALVRVKNHRQIPADQDVEVQKLLNGRYQVKWQDRSFWVDRKDVEETQAASATIAPVESSSATATNDDSSDDSAGDRPDANATVEPALATSSVEPGPQTSQPVASQPVSQPVTAQPLAPQPLAPQPLASQQATASTASASASSSAPPMAGGLEGVIAQIYQSKGGSPTADDFITALQAHFGDQAEAQINHPQFAWELMRLVGENSGKRLHEQIVEAKGRPLLFNRAEVFKLPWTLRHYTKSQNPSVPPTYTKLKSTLELSVSGIAKSANTNDSDWADIGNVGFSFYLLCVGGVAPSRSFLGNCTHYAEFPIESIPSLFVSGDMLGAAKGEKKQPGLSGSGDKVKEGLSSLNIDRSNPDAFLKGLDGLFGNFEVKVPGQLTVAQWHQM